MNNYGQTCLASKKLVNRNFILKLLIEIFGTVFAGLNWKHLIT